MSKKILVQIGLDDLCNRPDNSVDTVAYGLRLLTKIGLCVDVFVPFSLSRTPEEYNWYDIIDPKDKSNLAFKVLMPIITTGFHDSVFFHCHGYYHCAGHTSVNDEFLHLPTQELIDRISKIHHSSANFILRKRAFRPPGWKIRPEIIDTLSRFDVQCLSLNRTYAEKGMYDPWLKDCPIPLHFSSYSPPDVEYDYNKIKEEGRLDVTFHAATWLRNHLTEDNALRLISILERLASEGYEIISDPLIDEAPNGQNGLPYFSQISASMQKSGN